MKPRFPLSHRACHERPRETRVKVKPKRRAVCRPPSSDENRRPHPAVSNRRDPADLVDAGHQSSILNPQASIQSLAPSPVLFGSVIPPARRPPSTDSLRSCSRKPVTRADVVEVFRDLHKLGVGTFVIGRKGHLSRFQWTVSSVELGKAAAGENVNVQVSAKHEGTPRERSDVISHRFVLRPDFSVSFVLPSDLSTSEASRLSDFIKTLPFDK